ncbi:hypothetical protein MJG53_018371 [Ovis ammon polii x Ovis aries]|uniref:Uncharacterized protein n=1 Tax=Ovis ammon polii x Ovis aries TaxID=2918886 RepID=A0ACB9U710_9CETA|nr:hypothetical protein MJG53_018371 [Ovis ammon polii x Ovis aries]
MLNWNNCPEAEQPHMKRGVFAPQSGPDLEHPEFSLRTSQEQRPREKPVRLPPLKHRDFQGMPSLPPYKTQQQPSQPPPPATTQPVLAAGLSPEPAPAMSKDLLPRSFWAIFQ